MTRACAPGWETESQLDRGRVEEPDRCGDCQNRDCMELINNRCQYTNKQIVRVQVGSLTPL
jgi:DNA replicative helicase MCM subunit Mcm2 (Cdc46/Mcm family)